MKKLFCIILLLSYILIMAGCDEEVSVLVENDFPVSAILIDDSLSGSEGLIFNSEGRLFVTGEKNVWEYTVSAGLTSVWESENSLVGLAADDSGNIYVCDSGANSMGEIADGKIIKIDSAGNESEYATNIPDPNFLIFLPDGSMLVSDDFDNYIYHVPANGGSATVWLSSIEAPNGMVLSLDNSELYVCQTFVTGGSLAADNRIWKVELDASYTPSEPELLATLPDGAWNDGSTIDHNGNIYIAANGIGQIWQINPATGDTKLISENMDFVASIDFGEGGFNHKSLYATQLYGGNVWEIPIFQ